MKNIDTLLNWSLLMLLTSMLVACGNKGPLYIPQPLEQTTQQSTGAS